MDIIIIALLCILNGRTVKAKGRRALWMVLLTVGLTLGLTFVITTIIIFIKIPTLGITADMDRNDMLSRLYDSMQGTAIYCTYLPLILGGSASILIARFCKPGQPKEGQHFGRDGAYQQNSRNESSGNCQNQYQQDFNQYAGDFREVKENTGTEQPREEMSARELRYAQQFEEGRIYDAEEMLKEPCTLCIIREGVTQKSDEMYTISLNGFPACRLSNNSFVNIMTNRKQNTITGRDGTGNSLKKPISFMAVDSGYVELRIRGDSFIPERTVGKRPKVTKGCRQEEEIWKDM